MNFQCAPWYRDRCEKLPQGGEVAPILVLWRPPDQSSWWVIEVIDLFKNHHVTLLSLQNMEQHKPSKTHLLVYLRPDPRPLIYVCDLHDFVEETEVLLEDWDLILLVGSPNNLPGHAWCETCKPDSHHTVCGSLPPAFNPEKRRLVQENSSELAGADRLPLQKLLDEVHWGPIEKAQIPLTEWHHRIRLVCTCNKTSKTTALSSHNQLLNLLASEQVYVVKVNPLKCPQARTWEPNQLSDLDHHNVLPVTSFIRSWTGRIGRMRTLNCKTDRFSVLPQWSHYLFEGDWKPHRPWLLRGLYQDSAAECWEAQHCFKFSELELEQWHRGGAYPAREGSRQKHGMVGCSPR